MLHRQLVFVHSEDIFYFLPSGFYGILNEFPHEFVYLFYCIHMLAKENVTETLSSLVHQAVRTNFVLQEPKALYKTCQKTQTTESCPRRERLCSC